MASSVGYKFRTRWELFFRQQFGKQSGQKVEKDKDCPTGPRAFQPSLFPKFQHTKQQHHDLTACKLKHTPWCFSPSQEFMCLIFLPVDDSSVKAFCVAAFPQKKSKLQTDIRHCRRTKKPQTKPAQIKWSGLFFKVERIQNVGTK